MSKGFLKSSRLAWTLAVLMPMLTSCKFTEMVGSLKNQPGAISAVTQGPASGGGGGGSAEMVAFIGSVHALVRNRCIACHGDRQDPMFAVADAQASHDLLLDRSLVNFANIPLSRIAQRAGDSHCGDNCHDSTSMETAILAWKNGQSSGGTGTGTGTGTDTGGNISNGNVFSQNLLLNIALPAANTGNFTRVRWQLNSIDAKLVGATFSIDIKEFSDDAYIVRLPRVYITTASGAGTWAVKDVKILVNDKWNQLETAYRSVDTFVDPSASEAVAPLLSTAAMTILKDKGFNKGNGSDNIKVSFVVFQSSPNGAACKSLANFQANVLPKIQSTCVSCHNASNRLNMSSADPATVCRQARSRTYPTDPINSPLIQNPLYRLNAHPANGLTSADISPTWLDWISSEK